MKSLDVYCYGEIGIDNIIEVAFLPNPERAAFPTGDTYHIGGAAANTAVWLASFGFKVGLTGNVIGRDVHGEDLWQRLAAYPHLDRRDLQRDAAIVTPFCRAMVTPDAERSFLIFGYPEAPKVHLTPDMLRGAQFLALDLYGGNERLDAARLARASGVQITVGDVIDPDHAILPLISIVTNSASYIREAQPDVDVWEHARVLQAVCQGIVITTDGAKPIHVVDRDRTTFSIDPPRVTAIDATGAGDAFRAGLLAGLLRGKSLRESVRWGTAAGSLGVQSLGAASTVPSLDAVLAVAETLKISENP